MLSQKIFITKSSLILTLINLKEIINEPIVVHMEIIDVHPFSLRCPFLFLFFVSKIRIKHINSDTFYPSLPFHLSIELLSNC